MKLKPLVAAIVLCGTASTGLAADISVEQKKGAASGLVVGALAGGPAGAFAGALIGGEVFGRLSGIRRINRQLDSQVASLEQTLDSERQSHASALAAVNRDLDTLLALQSITLKSQQLPIQFRTASSDIEPHYEDELKKIAHLLRRNRDASVVLTGYADRRGDEAYNQTLSEKRVETLKSWFEEQGVAPHQVAGAALGETQPLDSAESLESNFFDRRVILELKLDLDPQLATR